MSADVNRYIEELFAAPLKEFTSARNAQVAALNAAGHGAEAQLLERLGKPTGSLWAVNQLARLAPNRLGMGLTICRSIMQAHGGRLWATRNRDRGASFHFSLPTGDEMR
jgi:light-regulated signal transduction histidine kinase (bacteriophytochrome)